MILVVVLGGMGAAAFYQEEVGGFIKLQGWNTGPVSDATREFVKAAAAGDGVKVDRMLAQDARELRPVRGPKGVAAFMITAYGGAKKKTLKELCPTSDAKLSAPKLVFMEGGSVLVNATFPSHSIQTRWTPTAGKWKIIDITEGQSGL